IPSDSTVAVQSRTLQYGSATTTTVPSRASYPTITPDVPFKLRFLAGELLGFMFVLLSTVYIFVVPASLSRPALMRAMFDRILKRTLDIAGAIVGLVLTSPLWLVIPIAIKLDSSGPVFYTQTRVGINRRKRDRRCFNRTADSDRRDRDRRRADYMGKPFQVLKFRTMVQDAEKASGPVWAVKGDPRITRVGAFLRRTRIDEIPQFINVLRGEMALVGPRPERPNFVRDLSTRVTGYSARLEVKPGLTGLAQVENGYDTTVAGVADKIKYDLQYIREWSLLTDIKIMLRTVVVVFTGRGAC
ncbi:MAG: sugar transferase, partial [candidate division Zixibacteria bacterium]|nr:sugar transferase [candidate division Zixibacteria bacterium]